MFLHTGITGILMEGIVLVSLFYLFQWTMDIVIGIPLDRCLRWQATGFIGMSINSDIGVHMYHNSSLVSLVTQVSLDLRPYLMYGSCSCDHSIGGKGYVGIGELFHYSYYLFIGLTYSQWHLFIKVLVFHISVFYLPSIYILGRIGKE